MKDQLERLNLEYNPFEPSATGIGILKDFWLPRRWEEGINSCIQKIKASKGPRTLLLIGEYGSGKTYLMRWLELEKFKKTIPKFKVFYFDNPGVHFYDLANKLLQNLGRVDFAKALWEYLWPKITLKQPMLFPYNFWDWLKFVQQKKNRQDVIRKLFNVIKSSGITDKENVAYKLAELIIGTGERPYFEYQDFVAGRRGSLALEEEEAPFFTAIIKAINKLYGIEEIAFLIDEFEEISLQKRLGRRESSDYLATLKRLINVAERENLWLVLAMTPDGEDKTKQIDPALWDRIGENVFRIPQLNREEARELIIHRLKQARENQANIHDLFPFTDECIDVIREDIISKPRYLIKICSSIISSTDQDTQVPYQKDYIDKIQNLDYPLCEPHNREVGEKW